jgi:MFS family permease
MIVGVAYMTVKDPTSWWAYFLAVFGQGASMMIIVVMQGYVAKRTPKMIRGITNAVMGIMGSLGSLPYLVLTGIFVKMWGARMVWGT